jgi:hypothetical protein
VGRKQKDAWMLGSIMLTLLQQAQATHEHCVTILLPVLLPAASCLSL